MASLSFNKIINLTNMQSNPAPKYVGSLKIAQDATSNSDREPNGPIYQYYVVDSLTSDKRGIINNANYDALTFEAPGKSLTSVKVANIGIKSFPQLGAIGFYTRQDSLSSYMLLPIHIKNEKEKAPTLVVTQDTDGVHFSITQPEDTNYMCYRVVMTLGQNVYEYITYSNTLTVDPPSNTGTYDIYCVGYVSEGERISQDSTHQAVAITGSGQPDAPANDIYVTSAMFDANNVLKLTLSSGEVIAASNAPVSTNKLLSVQLPSSGWSGTEAPYSQTISNSDIKVSGFAYVASPTSANWEAYCKCGIYMDEPATDGSVTFYATTELPTSSLSVNVLRMVIS